MPKTNTFDNLTRTLGYSFTDETLLQRALTHRSHSGNHNERLEFLGDSILNFIIAESLFEQFPSAREGELSRLRASLVKGETLAQVAKAFQLGDYLRLGEGELKSGGFRRASILADATEAIIGAIYLDGGMDQVQSCVQSWFAQKLKDISLEDDARDPKSQLQEWLQARKLPLPEYDVVATEGEAHNQCFTVVCRVSVAKEPTQAKANNRKRAEKEAAKAMLKKLAVGK